MSDINQLHEEAMELTDEALLAKREGQHDEAKTLFRRAFELERKVAELLRDDLSAEPTRSILYRSAATLALDCGELGEAMQLVRTGLAGNPPEEIAKELRELRTRVQRLQAQPSTNRNSNVSSLKNEPKSKKLTRPSIPNTSIAKTMTPSTSATKIQHSITRQWSAQPSHRTVLYYSFLLTKHYGDQPEYIRNNLVTASSLPEDELAYIVQEFASNNIMTSTQECKLSPIAMLEMENLLTQDLGDVNPVPFDGLSIFTATSNERRQLWLEAGTQQLSNLFANISGLTISRDDVHRDYRILLFEWDDDLPILIFCFFNKSRLTNLQEIIPLVTYAAEVQRNRAVTNKAITENSSTVITIMAVPAYSASIANSMLNFHMPVTLIGPLNFAAIIHYLQNHSQNRELQLRALLDYLNPVRNILSSPLMFSPPLIDHMRKLTAESP